MKPYLHIILVSAREDKANIGRLVSGITLSLVRVGLIAAIYFAAYKYGASKTGLSYENAVWSIAIYFAFILNLGLRNVFKTVEEAVISGSIETEITKPVDWRLRKICELLGKNGLEFLVQLVVFPLFLFFVVGAPNVGHLSGNVILAFVALTFLAMIAASALFTTIGLAAFWLNDAKPVFRIIEKIVIIFGGAFVPVALLPHAVQTAVRYSPFGVYAAPTQLFNPNIAHVLVPTLVSAAVWVVLLLWFCQFVWNRAMARIEVNGG
jgi:ABC-2 type transport system permease protein